MNLPLFNFVEFTNRNIFLTGKAGTGKTTFLNDFVKRTQKKYIIVAPTGIAAINAGGVTIHSMFGLPLRAFLPTLERIDGNLGNNIVDLSHHFKYRKDKLKLLREVEIIIIDEVSMLRADVLDMMDFALRHIRRNTHKFGGVQMLFIGDLYQLPPVVKDENVLKEYYKSPFFFDAHSLQEIPVTTIELTKVYRQKDENFLQILNAIRDGKTSEVNFNELNKRYLPNFEAQDEAYVYLTSHNKMADDINQNELKNLAGKAYFYKAIIQGDFKENQFPNEEILELKVGSQVMFIRNDASGEKKYFNGKLAEVTSLSEDEIWVRIENQNEEYKVKREVWEQKKYSLDSEKNIQEEVLGSFEQFPIRLAWAVTIHKSQGLTFDRVIIDAGKSFASGQVYVALSRCRTLEGIVLKSKITPQVIFSDYRVESFQKSTNANDKIEEILETEKYSYAIQKIINRLDCRWIQKSVELWHSQSLVSKGITDKNKFRNVYNAVIFDAKNYIDIFEKFEKIIYQKNQKFVSGKEEWKEIEDKAKGATNFFFKNINSNIFSPLKELYAETKALKGLKQYNEDFRTFLDDLEDYLNDFKTLYLLESHLFNKENDVKISTDIAKTPSHIITYQLFENGKTIPEIAKERGLVVETVYGHLAKFASQGVLDITRIISKEKIEIFQNIFKENTETKTLTEWKTKLPNEFEFHEIRLLLNHFQYLKEKESSTD